MRIWLSVVACLVIVGCKGPRPEGAGPNAQATSTSTSTKTAEATKPAQKPEAQEPEAPKPDAQEPTAQKPPTQKPPTQKPAPKPEPPAPTVKKPAGKLELVDATPEVPADIVIHNAVAKAAEDHRDLLVYVGATWCAPCERFKAAAKSGLLDKDLPGLRVLVFDADADTDRLRAAGYRWTYVPLFVRPAVSGRSSGVQIAGVPSKGAGVENLVPRVKKLLGRGG